MPHAQLPIDRLLAIRHLIEVEQKVVARHQAKAEINVTPLVDVVLVLLIIFMVVTPLIASGVAVKLPQTAHHTKQADDGKEILISITADDRLYLGARLMPTLEALVAAIVAQKHAFPGKTIFLRGDVQSSFGRAREVMAALHTAAVDDIVLGTEEITAKR